MILTNKLVKQKSSNSNYQIVMRYVQLLISGSAGGREGGKEGVLWLTCQGNAAVKIITQHFCSAIGRTISSAAASITELMHLIVAARQTGRGIPQKWGSSPCGSVGLCECVYVYMWDLCAMYDCEDVCWKGFPLCNDFCCKWKNTRACHTMIFVSPTPKTTTTPVENHPLVINISSQCTGIALAMLLLCLKESKHASKRAWVNSKR